MHRLAAAPASSQSAVPRASRCRAAGCTRINFRLHASQPKESQPHGTEPKAHEASHSSAPVDSSSSTSTDATSTGRQAGDATTAASESAPEPAGFQPPEGERPLWWVERYEARRKEMAAQAAAAAAAGAGASPSSTPSEAATQQQQQQPAAPGGTKAPSPAPVWARLASMLQLVVVNAALILWPASRQPGGLLVGRVWLLYITYVVFFAGGTLYRLSRHGALAPRATDQQVTSSWASRLSFIAFVMSMPILHWLPLLRYIGSTAALSDAITAYDVLGGACLAAAIAINWVAARQLGKAYDRVVAPEALVTTGLYRHMQHPIYTSYMLLFCGFSLSLHSAPFALLALLVCSTYYSQRCRLEAEVLRRAFGAQYERYAKVTKMFLPLVV